MIIRIQTEPDTARFILGFLIAIEIAFALVYLTETTLGSPSHLLHELMNLDGEATVQSWFSAVQLSVIGLVFLYFATNVPAMRASRRLLLLLSAAFLFVSLDENVSLHERVTYRLQDVEWLPRFQGNHGIWVYLYLAIAVVVLLVNLKPMLNLAKEYPRNARIFIVGTAVFVFGAVVMEIVGYSLVGDGEPGTAYYLEVTVEEFMEMAGASLMLYSLMIPQTHPEPQRA
jgi:hypothetical protein